MADVTGTDHRALAALTDYRISEVETGISKMSDQITELASDVKVASALAGMNTEKLDDIATKLDQHIGAYAVNTRGSTTGDDSKQSGFWNPKVLTAGAMFFVALAAAVAALGRHIVEEIIAFFK